MEPHGPVIPMRPSPMRTWKDDDLTGGQPMEYTMTTSCAQSAGGHARAQSLSSERRSEIARNAAEARWSKKSPSDSDHTL